MQNYEILQIILREDAIFSIRERTVGNNIIRVGFLTERMYYEKSEVEWCS